MTTGTKELAFAGITCIKDLRIRNLTNARHRVYAVKSNEICIHTAGRWKPISDKEYDAISKSDVFAFMPECCLEFEDAIRLVISDGAKVTDEISDFYGRTNNVYKYNHTKHCIVNKRGELAKFDYNQIHVPWRLVE